MFKRLLSLTVIFCFFLTSLGPLPKAHADSVLGLPAPGTMVNLSPAYEPVMIKGLTVHKDNPFLFDFIVDVGQDKISGQPLKAEGEKLIKYFLASLAIPDKDVWVNLSPYEKNRMIPEVLGQTDMGRDLLEQDYILKQITASLIYPEKQLGKTFWDKVYAKAQQEYGTTQIPVNTFNKVWIMADRAEVFEHNQTAFVVDQHLKVMLEEDYLALQEHSAIPPSIIKEGVRGSSKDTHTIASQVVRSIILPELEKEVNTGKNFANLRQIFNSIILSSWYKRNLKEALLNQVYANQSKVKGINLNDPTIKQQIYEQYLKAYKKGVFNYIKEDTLQGQTIPRKYFSGGMDPAMALHPTNTTDLASLSVLKGRQFVDMAAIASTNKPMNPNFDAAMRVNEKRLGIEMPVIKLGDDYYGEEGARAFALALKGLLADIKDHDTYYDLPKTKNIVFSFGQDSGDSSDEINLVKALQKIANIKIMYVRLHRKYDEIGIDRIYLEKDNEKIEEIVKRISKVLVILNQKFKLSMAVTQVPPIKSFKPLEIETQGVIFKANRNEMGWRPRGRHVVWFYPETQVDYVIKAMEALVKDLDSYISHPLDSKGMGSIPFAQEVRFLVHRLAGVTEFSHSILLALGQQYGLFYDDSDNNFYICIENTRDVQSNSDLIRDEVTGVVYSEKLANNLATKAKQVRAEVKRDLQRIYQAFPGQAKAAQGQAARPAVTTDAAMTVFTVGDFDNYDVEIRTAYRNPNQTVRGINLQTILDRLNALSGPLVLEDSNRARESRHNLLELIKNMIKSLLDTDRNSVILFNQIKDKILNIKDAAMAARNDDTQVKRKILSDGSVELTYPSIMPLVLTLKVYGAKMPKLDENKYRLLLVALAPHHLTEGYIYPNPNLSFTRTVDLEKQESIESGGGDWFLDDGSRIIYDILDAKTIEITYQPQAGTGSKNLRLKIQMENFPKLNLGWQDAFRLLRIVFPKQLGSIGIPSDAKIAAKGKAATPNAVMTAVGATRVGVPPNFKMALKLNIPKRRKLGTIVGDISVGEIPVDLSNRQTASHFRDLIEMASLGKMPFNEAKLLFAYDSQSTYGMAIGLYNNSKIPLHFITLDSDGTFIGVYGVSTKTNVGLLTRPPTNVSSIVGVRFKINEQDGTIVIEDAAMLNGIVDDIKQRKFGVDVNEEAVFYPGFKSGFTYRHEQEIKHRIGSGHGRILSVRDRGAEIPLVEAQSRVNPNSVLHEINYINGDTDYVLFEGNPVEAHVVAVEPVEVWTGGRITVPDTVRMLDRAVEEFLSKINRDPEFTFSIAANVMENRHFDYLSEPLSWGWHRIRVYQNVPHYATDGPKLDKLKGLLVDFLQKSFPNLEISPTRGFHGVNAPGDPLAVELSISDKAMLGEGQTRHIDGLAPLTVGVQRQHDPMALAEQIGRDLQQFIVANKRNSSHGPVEIRVLAAMVRQNPKENIRTTPLGNQVIYVSYSDILDIAGHESSQTLARPEILDQVVKYLTAHIGVERFNGMLGYTIKRGDTGGLAAAYEVFVEFILIRGSPKQIRGDQAMLNPGGIDLNTSSGMQWKVSKDGNGVEMNVDPAMIERVRREGINWLSPVIFKMTPVTSVWSLVGLQAPAQVEHLAGL